MNKTINNLKFNTQKCIIKDDITQNGIETYDVLYIK